jgi:hypothetical protein
MNTLLDLERGSLEVSLAKPTEAASPRIKMASRSPNGPHGDRAERGKGGSTRVTTAIDELICRTIELGDYVRRPQHRLMDRSGYKEWFHFCICSPELDAIVNFNISDAKPSGSAAQLTCAVRSEAWYGDIDLFDAHEVMARPGRHKVRLGQSSVEFRDGHYQLHAKLKDHPVELTLALYPLSVPSQVNNIVLESEPSLQWFLVPRLLAFGQVTINDRVIEIRGAQAYHDHNWGYFDWGGNFSWVWGYGHGSGVNSPWSFAFDRLSDRARTKDFERGLLLWKGKERRRLFRSRDLKVVESGVLRPATHLRLPRALSLTRSATPVEVPALVTGRAECGKDVVEFEFRAQNLCQLLIPHDQSLGLTAINEVSGTVSLAGSLGPDQVDLKGHAMFEFVSD